MNPNVLPAIIFILGIVLIFLLIRYKGKGQ